MELPRTHVGTNPSIRQGRCVSKQRQQSLRCPEAPRLDGRLALITGANAGIGFATASGLLDRGATVLLAGRDEAKLERAAERLAEAEGSAPERLLTVTVDLADLDAVEAAVARLPARLDGRRVDILVENAAVLPQRPDRTAQGYELAFGTNVLGHFALRRGLQQEDLLYPEARVIVVTADSYILEQDCTADYRPVGAEGGKRAYYRSKLGNLWIGRELARRHPELQVYCVHPGVVSTGLVGLSGFGALFALRSLLEPEAGAQMALICATQPGLESGAYYHNIHGQVVLAAQDPGSNDEGAGRLWEACEAILAGRS